MSVQVTIRNVPGAVRDELASRAAREGKSMQEYLRMELERLASRPPVGRLLEQIREDALRRDPAPRRRLARPELPLPPATSGMT